MYGHLGDSPSFAAPVAITLPRACGPDEYAGMFIGTGANGEAVACYAPGSREGTPAEQAALQAQDDIANAARAAATAAYLATLPTDGSLTPGEVAASNLSAFSGGPPSMLLADPSAYYRAFQLGSKNGVWDPPTAAANSQAIVGIEVDTYNKLSAQGAAPPPATAVASGMLSPAAAAQIVGPNAPAFIPLPQPTTITDTGGGFIAPNMPAGTPPIYAGVPAETVAPSGVNIPVVLGIAALGAFLLFRRK